MRRTSSLASCSESPKPFAGVVLRTADKERPTTVFKPLSYWVAGGSTPLSQ